MNGTGFLVQPGIRHVIVHGRAIGYTDGRGPLENALWVYPNSGGGLYSTVDDLYRFDQALRAGKLLSTAMTEAALTPFKANYGLGWFVFKTPTGRLAMHGGGIPGYAINFSRFLEESLTVVLLSNLDTAPLDRMANDVRGIDGTSLSERGQTPRIYHREKRPPLFNRLDDGAGRGRPPPGADPRPCARSPRTRDRDPSPPRFRPPHGR